MMDQNENEAPSPGRKRQVPVLERKLDRECPCCRKLEVFVIESSPGKRFGYWCKACGAEFHTKLAFNVHRGKYVWLGFLLNPAYWNRDNPSPTEGTGSTRRREDDEIPAYLDDWEMEEESSDK